MPPPKSTEQPRARSKTRLYCLSMFMTIRQSDNMELHMQCSAEVLVENLREEGFPFPTPGSGVLNIQPTGQMWPVVQCHQTLSCCKISESMGFSGPCMLGCLILAHKARQGFTGTPEPNPRFRGWEGVVLGTQDSIPAHCTRRGQCQAPGPNLVHRPVLYHSSVL